MRRSLTYHIGDWNRVYASLDKYGLEFDLQHDYGSLLLLQVLLELGLDPSKERQLISCVARDGNTEALLLLLSDPRTNPENETTSAFDVAIRRGHAEVVRILLADGRFDPTIEEGEESVLTTAVEDCNIDIVRILLEDKRIDPSANKNEALLAAAKYGYAAIFQLLLSREEVLEMEEETGDDYGLESAVMGSHVSIVKLILQLPYIQFLNYWLLVACRGSSYETVKVLLEDQRVHPEVPSCRRRHACVVEGNRALRIARNTKREDIEALLLANGSVRALDTHSLRRD